MRRRFAVSFVTFAVVAGAVLAGQEPRFRSGVNLVLVDVVVRDRSGAIVTGLTADDFELVEDGLKRLMICEIGKPSGARAASKLRKIAMPSCA